MVGGFGHISGTVRLARATSFEGNELEGGRAQQESHSAILSDLIYSFAFLLLMSLSVLLADSFWTFLPTHGRKSHEQSDLSGQTPPGIVQ